MVRRHRAALAVAVGFSFLAQCVGAADLAPFALAARMPPPGLLMPAALRPQPALPAPRASTWRSELGAAFAPAALLEDAAVPEDARAAIAPAPPADRMLIDMRGLRVLAAGDTSALNALRFRGELKPWRARFAGRPLAAGGVSARLDYLAPRGVTRGTASGFDVTLSDGITRHLRAAPGRSITPDLRRDFPVYLEGDRVTVEVAVRNDGPSALRGLRAEAVEEAYDSAGRASRALGPSDAAAAAGALAPGATARLRWTVSLAAGDAPGVSLEQTHLRLYARGPDGVERLLLDQPQAGVVDPPTF